MWGQIATDFLYLGNYNTGFPTTRTDSLLRITHWQYWWWFWFTYFLVLYYFLVLRLFRLRLLKFRPKLSTTTRSHGKWGDLIVCLLPISWCANILSNSNMILRMLEWQSESSLFTVRVRGKQWYWIYKFELKSITDVLSAPKNIGHNRWFISVFNDLKVADDYFHITQLRAQGNWAFMYWKALLERHLRDPQFFATSPQELLIMDHNRAVKTFSFTKKLKQIDAERMAKNFKTPNQNAFLNLQNISDKALQDLEAFQKMKYTSFGVSYENHNPKGRLFSPKSPCGFFPKKNFYKGLAINSLTDELKNFLKNDPTLNFNNPDVLDVTRWAKQPDGLQKPLRIIKTPLKYTNFNEESVELNSNFRLFRLRFLESSDEPQIKPLPHTNYFTFKQKRYQRRDNFHGITKLFDQNLIRNFQTSPVDKSYAVKPPVLDYSSLKALKNFISTTTFVNDRGVLQHNEFFKKYLLLRFEQLLAELNEFESSYSENSTTKVTTDNKKNESTSTPDNSTKESTSTPDNSTKESTSTPDTKKNENSTDSKKNENLNKFNPYLVRNKLVVDNFSSVKKQYRMFTKNKNSSEDISNVLGRRLLRTKRTLVLPTHVNITIITNSYDVIHSWFIPGLGLKLDCIPGRSTHHLLHIDNVGFYYGQCAEICGRYHHHMPIRICALPFEHFLVWWHTFGLPKMLNSSSKLKLNSDYNTKKYTW